MRSSILTILIFLSLISHSQSLTGFWEGKITDENPAVSDPRLRSSVPLVLNITMEKDSTYSITSFTMLQDSLKNNIVVSSKVVYKMLGSDSIYLEEISVIEPAGFTNICFQKMNLRIRVRKKITELTGTWKTETGNCAGAGTVYFFKRN